MSAELKILNKDTTPEEVAAIVAVLASVQSAAPQPKPRSLWASRQRRTRATLRPGPGAWRASALPR